MARWQGCSQTGCSYRCQETSSLYRSVTSAKAVATAAKELGEQYVENKRAFIESQIKEINAADESRRSAAVWKTINMLSGRKSTPSGKISGSKEERLTGWLHHFQTLLYNSSHDKKDDDFVALPIVSEPLSDIRCGPFDLEEFNVAARQGKRGKKCGVDEIEQEILLIPEFQKILLPIINAIYTSHAVPSELTTSRLIALPKKGDLSKYDSYRGISLMSIVAKHYNRMLLNRIRDPIDKLLRNNQNGFRQHRSTMEPILALRRLIEEISTKKDLSLFVIFVDFFKAFDSVHRGRMFSILSAYGIPEETIAAIRCMYDNSKGFVATEDGDTETFNINVGVLQGDTLAPFLFIIVVDYILRQALGGCQELGVEIQKRCGSRVPAKHLTDLDFADDIALVASVWENAQTLLANVEKAALEVNLRINNGKTKAMCLHSVADKSSPVQNFTVSSGSIENVTNFCYLGSFVRNSEEDLRQRIGQAWTATSKLWQIWKANDISRPLKRRLFRSTVESVLLYGSQCWSLTKLQTQRLDGTYTRLLRKALNIPWATHITNAELYDKLKPPSVTIRSRRMMLAGHCYRRKDQPVSDLVLFEASHGKFRTGQHARATFLKQLKSDLRKTTSAAVANALTEMNEMQSLLDDRRRLRRHAAAARANIVNEDEPEYDSD